MALTQVSIAQITPRGGPPGAAVSIAGSGFGAAQGSIVFDPAGQATAAVVAGWTNESVQFTVPTLGSPLTNRFILVELVLASGDDGATFLWWSPAVGFTALPTHPDLDFQYPFAELGEDQDVDNPQTMTAADFNRLLSLALTALSAGAAAPHAATHTDGGADEVATAVPAPNAIPKADGAASLDAWVTHYTDQQAALAAQVFN